MEPTPSTESLAPPQAKDPSRVPPAHPEPGTFPAFPSDACMADYLVHTLEGLGVRSAFGVTGGAVGTLFSRMNLSEKIQVFHCQQEGGGAFMAMGRGIATHCEEIPVCFSTAGPGITNMTTGIAAAHAEGVPVFAITGNSSTTTVGKNALQDAFSTGIDGVRMMESITARSTTVWTADELIPTAVELFHLARQTRKPVHLNVPTDIANQVPRDPAKILEFIRSIQRPTRHWELTARDREGIQLFMECQRPVLFLGNGLKLSHLSAEVLALVESHQLPFLLTCHAKGMISEDHPLFRGIFGFACDGTAEKFLEVYQPDGIFFLGTGLGELSTGGWSAALKKPALRIHADWDRKKLRESAFECHYSIHGELSQVITALGECSRPNGKRRVPPRPENTFYGPLQDQAPLHPGKMFQVLDLFLDDHSVVFADNGNAMAWAIHDYTPKGSLGFYVPLGLASMGSAIGAAMGAATVPGRGPVLCFTGDCSMMMNGSELKTAFEFGIPIKLFVLNDGGHGMVDHGSRLIGLKGVPVRFKKPVDFELYGKAFGVETLVVETMGEFLNLPFHDILRSPDPLLVDLRIDITAVPPIASRAKVLGQSDARLQ